MKLALITDTHWGIRNDSPIFHDYTKKFLDNSFFPYLKENNITTVVHLGDIFDKRKQVNIQTANRLRKDFLEVLHVMQIEMHLIAGNHDTYYKNTNKINSIDEFITGVYPNIISYTNNAETIEFDGLPILFVPWICDENRDQILQEMERTNAQICMGHLEIQGFEMYKGSIVSHGDDRKLFNKFDMVFSGHFHHRSSDGQIFYLGSHAEFTWSDYDDPKGFHIFDTETREIKFVENPYRMFKKIWYNDTDENFIKNKIDYSQYSNCILKVIVTNKSNPYWFDRFIENLEKENPVDMQIVEDHFNLDVENDEDIINEAESTLDIFKKYIQNYDLKNVPRDKLEIKINQLYEEALSLE
jgi:DNA repair exonuclease SbcCD nuclease subunit